MTADTTDRSAEVEASQPIGTDDLFGPVSGGHASVKIDTGAEGGVGNAPLPLLIGLSGKKRMGKDTLASELIMDYGFKRFAIADAIKDLALEIDPWMVNTLTGQPARLREVHEACGGSFEGIKANPGWDPSVREFLQRVGGTVALRDPEFWPKPTIENALKHIETTGNGAVLPDVRFRWEVEMIRAAGGVVLRVCRSDRPDSEQTDTHLSETALDDLSVWSPEYVIDTTPLGTLPSRVTDMVAVLRALTKDRVSV